MSTNDPTPSDEVSFSGRAEYTPALILEQVIGIRALLGTIFTLQLESFAHATGEDPIELRDRYVSKLGELTLTYAQAAKAAMERQPPIE